MPTYPPTSFVSSLIQKNVWSEKKKIHHMLQALILESQLLYKQHATESMMRFIQ